MNARGPWLGCAAAKARAMVRDRTRTLSSRGTEARRPSEPIDSELPPGIRAPEAIAA
jgi:hypothetical protein